MESQSLQNDLKINIGQIQYRLSEMTKEMAKSSPSDIKLLMCLVSIKLSIEVMIHDLQDLQNTPNVK